MMGQKIVVGPITKGLRDDVTPFNIDNDAFPLLINAYQWRQRIKRKRGTQLFGRLTRYFSSTDSEFNPGSATQTLDGSGNGELLTGFTNLSILAPASIVSGTVSITDTVTTIVYTDPSEDGTLSPSGTINYASGAITIAAAAGDAITALFSYYPDLPVLGLETLAINTTTLPGMIAFDQTYSYNLNLSTMAITDVSFYINPPTGIYPGYIQKTHWTPLIWNLQNYQQVWSTNDQNAFWAVGGITAPFSITNVGMQYKFITGITYVGSPGPSTPPSIATLTIVAHGLVVGDFLFLNEISGITGINMQTCYVTAVIDVDTVTVEFPLATLAGAYTGGGIAQYLTNTATPSVDCARYYNGFPFSVPPTFQTGFGWVNFSPPLISALVEDFSIADLPPGQYYLVTARMVVPFKDRLLFLGPVIQTSVAGSQVYLPDTVIYSQNGTPFYTCSFAYDTLYPLDPSLLGPFLPMLTPTNPNIATASVQTAFPYSWWEDMTGYGGFVQAGFSRPITSVSNNEDALIVGFTDRQTRLLYTGNDIVPFAFYIINSELGSEATFSVITLDRGVLSVGGRGIIITAQNESSRIDLQIPDHVFQISLNTQGARRICAQRDFINEWVYFTYPSNDVDYVFPNQTLLYNYREGTWGLFNESYTTYGSVRLFTSFTWQSATYFTWDDWTNPWNWGSETEEQPLVVAGNAQGFVLIRSRVQTGEATSLWIQNINAATSVVTSPNHCLNNGNFIEITGVLGTIGPAVNGLIFSVQNPDTNTFTLNPALQVLGTYLGGGLITRFYVPQVQTRQFPVAWEMGRKTRIGVQQYLLTTTVSNQITLLIFLSQNSANAYNDSPIVPENNVTNSSLIYSTVLYTCPESTNLGLTPANINLQMLTGVQQQQIWHRMNTSLLGDTIQLGFTISPSQMRMTTLNGNPIDNRTAEVELHSIILDVTPSQLLA